jgi:hypothetical protein
MYGAFLSSVQRLLKIQIDPAPQESERSATGEPAAAAGSVPSRVTAERAQPDDAHVREWKRTWVSGAESRWGGKPLPANPHKPGSSRAAAWRAGWHWADSQPDRRQPRAVRLAHQYRRRTDSPSRLVRSAQAGALGLSVLTIAGWLWQTRRQRGRNRNDG